MQNAMRLGKPEAKTAETTKIAGEIFARCLSGALSNGHRDESASRATSCVKTACCGQWFLFDNRVGHVLEAFEQTLPSGSASSSPPEPYHCSVVQVHVRWYLRANGGETILGHDGCCGEVFRTELCETVELDGAANQCIVTEYTAGQIEVKKWTTPPWDQRCNPIRLFCQKSYDPDRHTFIDLPSVKHAQTKPDGGNRAGSGTNHRSPLATLDVFSGCGGLSVGLEQSGHFRVQWAIENDPHAASAFAANHPKAIVVQADASLVLEGLIGAPSPSPCKNTVSTRIRPVKCDNRSADPRMPSKGKVQAIVGGPPCQGYSGLNRNAACKSSELKRSQVAVFLGFVDHYRPEDGMYFILIYA
jgi:hypothetical protein